MIATRRRKQRFNVGPLVLPLAAIAAFAFALVFPPSHRLIFDGPLAPLFRVAGNAWTTAMRPMSFAAENQTIADRNREIRRLNGALEDQRKQLADRDGTIQNLRGDVTRLSAQPPPPVAARSLKAGVAQTAGATSGGAPAPGATGQPAASTEEMRRTANVWATMDADKAAAIAKKLPEPYVTSVLALMPADSAGDVLAALPADLAARLTANLPNAAPSAKS